MPFITIKSLPRRTVLRGIGATLALPFLDSMVPAFSLRARAIGKPAHRFQTFYVPNGMAMCKIHHAAYDRDFLGVTPDYEIRINADLLNEVDGPMLKHGLQEMHGAQLTLPRRTSDRPARDRLAERFEAFAAK